MNTRLSPINSYNKGKLSKSKINKYKFKKNIDKKKYKNYLFISMRLTKSLMKKILFTKKSNFGLMIRGMSMLYVYDLIQN